MERDLVMESSDRNLLTEMELYNLLIAQSWFSVDKLHRVTSEEYLVLIDGRWVKF